MVDFVSARSALCAHVDEAWQAGAVGIVGYIPELRFPRIVYKEPVNPSVHWGQVSIQSVMSSQTAFGSGNKQRRYTEDGLIFIQLFAPKSEIEGAEQQDQLAHIMRAAFRGRSVPGKIWFRNARINDLDPEDEMLRLNVVAEYEYNEITQP